MRTTNSSAPGERAGDRLHIDVLLRVAWATLAPVPLPAAPVMVLTIEARPAVGAGGAEGALPYQVAVDCVAAVAAVPDVTVGDAGRLARPVHRSDSQRDKVLLLPAVPGLKDSSPLGAVASYRPAPGCCCHLSAGGDPAAVGIDLAVGPFAFAAGQVVGCILGARSRVEAGVAVSYVAAATSSLLPLVGALQTAVPARLSVSAVAGSSQCFQ